MRRVGGWRAGVVAGLAVAIAGSAAFAAAQPQPGTQGQRPPRRAQVAGGQEDGGRQRPGRPGRHVLHAVVHGDMIAVDRDGQTKNVVYDRGEITSIDSSAKSFDLKRRDGVTVKVVVSDDTKIREQGSEESFEDLAVGDRLMALAEKDASGGLHWVLIRCVTRPRGSEPAPPAA